jgi:tRNA dimethylallyltransferase
MQKTIILITGPTAVGKTAAAVELARYFQTEIISADSRQCYRELNIGVARPTVQELKVVPHHFIASHSIHDNISAAFFESYALHLAADVFCHRDVLVVAGGTGLYVKALIEGLDDIPAIDPSIRAGIIESYQTLGIGWLQRELADRDSQYTSGGSMQNPQRMLRALEVVLGTGQSILSFQQKNKKERPFKVISVQLDMPRAALYARINLRVDQMIGSGLEQEVRALYPFRNLNALQTVGYREIFDYIEEKYDLETAVEIIKRNTRHFAKRQTTWFSHQLTAKIFHPEDIQGMLLYLTSELASNGE